MDAREHNNAKGGSLRGISLQVVNTLALALAIVLSVFAVVTATQVLSEHAYLKDAHQTYESCSDATVQLLSASDYLTSSARMFVTTGEQSYLDDYLRELTVTQTREESLETLRNNVTDEDAYLKLSEAYEASSKLCIRELYAMRLTAEAHHMESLPQKLADIRLGDDALLADDQKQAEAENTILGSEYETSKQLIRKNANECTTDLIAELEKNENEAESLLEDLLTNLRVIVFLLVGIIIATVILNYVLVVRPTGIFAKRIRENKPLDNLGSIELRRVVDSYNAIYEENRRKTAMLQQEAQTDALTGLLNRGSYNRLFELNQEHAALLLIDVDLFKQVNDTYGHEIGDQVLKRVASSLVEHFRATDHMFRIGGDEFAVIATNMGSENRSILVTRLDNLAADLRESSDELPSTTLSIGIAFADSLPTTMSLYRAADEALYQAKDQGRNCYCFYNAA